MSWCGFITCDGPPSTQLELERLCAIEREYNKDTRLIAAVRAIPTPTLARMLAFRDRPECAAEVAFAVAALRARGVEVAEPEPPTQPSSELAALQNVRATPTPETHGNALAPTQPSIAPGPGDGAPRCSVCGNLCVDIAKDEHGACPDCSELYDMAEPPDLNGSDDFEVEPR